MKYIAALIVNLIFLIKGSFSQYNPCPDIFQFKFNGNRAYGIITIPPPSRGLTILRVEIGIRDSHDGSPSSLGLVKDLNAAVRDADRGKDIQYIYNFPQSRNLPTIRNINLNYEDICDGFKEENVYTFWNEHKLENPEGVKYLSHISFRRATPRPTPAPTPAPTPFYPRTRAPPVYHTTEDLSWIFNFFPTTPPPPPRTPPPRPRPTPPRPKTPPSPPRTTPPPRTTSPPRITTLEPRAVTPSRMTRPNDGSWLGSMPSAGTCGRQPSLINEVQTTQLIIGGTEVKKGEFPWMVALFHYKGRIVEPVCGASLISDSFVITAAHCTRDQKKVYMELGKHDISDPFEETYVPRISLNIIEHPEYRPGGAHGDVALVQIETIHFTRMIKPICLWAQGPRFDNIKQEGTVTGWGRIQNDGPTSTKPMKLNITTVGLDVCRQADDKLRDIASDMTFCAGGNGKGPCHGDSGSGFYMEHNNIWYLRGIISTSLGDQISCNLERYAVYVELTYVLDWMKPYLMP